MSFLWCDNGLRVRSWILGRLMVVQALLSLVLMLIISPSTQAHHIEPAVMVASAARALAQDIIKNAGRIQSDANYVAGLIETHIVPLVDQELFAKLSLGKKDWDSANEQQKTLFVAGFKKLLIRSYIGAFKAYNGEEMTFDEPQFNKDRLKAMIRSVVVRKGDEPVEIRYLMYKKHGHWKMYDAVVGGLDLIKIYRAQLSEQIQREGLDKTIKSLVNTQY